MNRILILFVMNGLLKILIISIIIDYYYNYDKVFNNPEKMIKIDIKNNIDFDKMT